MVDYARSKESLQLKIKDDLNNEVMNLNTEKTSLIQELNKRLVELDRINEEKRDLSSKLIIQIRFIRDLQGSLGTADNGNIHDIIDKDIESKFREVK